MPYFHTVESVLGNTGKSLPRTLATRMRPYSERTRGVRKADRVCHIEARLGHVCWLASAKEAIECVAIIRGVTVTNQHSRNVRPAECAASRLGDDIVETDCCTIPRQPLDDAPSALRSLPLESFEARPYRTCITNVERK